jgi:hypothetical protein
LIASSRVPFNSRVLDSLSSILPRVPRSPLRNPLLSLPPCLALRRFLLRLRMIQMSVVTNLGPGAMEMLTKLQTATDAADFTETEDDAKVSPMSWSWKNGGANTVTGCQQR